jgi:hypothetical protein
MVRNEEVLEAINSLTDAVKKISVKTGPSKSQVIFESAEDVSQDSQPKAPSGWNNIYVPQRFRNFLPHFGSDDIGDD